MPQTIHNARSASRAHKSSTSKAISVDHLLSETETAELLGLRPATIRAWRSTGRPGQPPFVRIGSRVKYRASDLAAYIEGLSAGTEL
jgi:hypothetical protein